MCKCGVRETLEYQREEACFFENAQVSGMVKQGLYLTWILSLTVLQPFKNCCSRRNRHGGELMPGGCFKESLPTAEGSPLDSGVIMKGSRCKCSS